MARITHVKKAQQRYATVPVIDSETGEQKRTPVMLKNGTQKQTKHGRPVFLSITVADKSKPLPPLVCDSCRKEIAVGSPYKHISPKSGPYGGRTLTRHEGCPTWNVWEYSSSLSARIAQIQATEIDVSSIETEDDVSGLLEDVISQIEDLKSEKEEAADNVEDGFGHETETSMALREVVDGLQEWIDNLENFEAPALPEPEDGEEKFFLVNVDGSGDVQEAGFDDEAEAQSELDSLVASGAAKEDEVEIESRTEELDEPTDEQMDDWRAEVQEAIEEAINDCQVG